MSQPLSSDADISSDNEVRHAENPAERKMTDNDKVEYNSVIVMIAPNVPLDDANKVSSWLGGKYSEKGQDVASIPMRGDTNQQICSELEPPFLLFIVGHADSRGVNLVGEPIPFNPRKRANISAHDLASAVDDIGIANKVAMVSLIACNAGKDLENGLAVKLCREFHNSGHSPYVSARKGGVTVASDGRLITPARNVNHSSGSRAKLGELPNGDLMWSYNTAVKTVLKVNARGKMDSITGFTTYRDPVPKLSKT